MSAGRYVIMAILLQSVMVGASFGKEASIPQMKQEADKVLAMGNVEARPHIETVMRLADRLAKEGKTADAVKYYEAGLKHYPLDLKRQLACAKAQMSLGQKDKALAKAGIVGKMAEDDNLVIAARKMLGQPVDTKVLALEKLNVAAPTVVLVPMDGVDVLLLREVQKKVQEASGFSILIRTVPLTVPPFKRDPFAQFCGTLRERLGQMESDDPDKFADILEQANVKASDLQKDEKVIALFQWVIDQSDSDKAKEFEFLVSRIRQEDKQWNAEDLIKTLAQATEKNQQPNIRFLGITRHDLFSGNNSFVFASALMGEIGVASYRRFMSSHTDETADRARLVKRTVNQLLSSCGKLYNVDNCIDPTCPRAYPNSVAEHDAKSDKLCEHCRAAFDTVRQKK